MLYSFIFMILEFLKVVGFVIVVFVLCFIGAGHDLKHQDRLDKKFEEWKRKREEKT